MGMMIPTRENEQTNPMEHAKTLMARKDEIESEIATQGEILKANNSDLTSSLVDAEGFPREDVDVWAVRHARVRIIELRNDLKDVMGELAIALQSVYPPSTSKETDTPVPPPSAPAPQTPFAKVDGIHPGSPAATAGLQRGDLVVSFGTLKKSSFQGTSLQPLAELVSRRENLSVAITVLRNENSITLNLVPKKWGGRGLLGCHLVPHST